MTPWEACAGAGSWQDLWTCRERGAHTGAGLLAGLVTHGGPTLEQSVPEGLHHVEGTHAGAVCEELQPVGRTHGEVQEVPMEGLSPSEEEGAAETMCDELTATPIPYSPAHCWGGGGREIGSEVEPRGEKGGKCFKI